MRDIVKQSTEPAADAFPATQWSLVGRAAAPPNQASRVAMDVLLRQYIPALRSHLVARKRIPVADAEDLIQGFIAAKVLERNVLAMADRTRGKFRSFLLTSLDRYVVDQQRHRAAQKRQGPIDTLDAADTDPAAPQRSVEKSFETAWAREILNRAVEQTRAECTATGRDDIWGVFEARILQPAMDGVEPMDYELLVRNFGLKDPAQASNVLMTSKRMFLRHLRAVVGEYVDDPAEIDAELAELRKIVSS